MPKLTEAERHIYPSVHMIITAWDNGLSPVRWLAKAWTNAGLSLIGKWETNFSELFSNVFVMKMHLKMPFAKSRPSSLGRDFVWFHLIHIKISLRIFWCECGYGLVWLQNTVLNQSLFQSRQITGVSIDHYVYTSIICGVHRSIAYCKGSKLVLITLPFFMINSC